MWPRVGVGAAIVRDGKLLLIRRLRPPEAGFWSLPGGKVDPFETVEATARREIAEELGIELKALSLLCVVDHMADGQHWVAPTFLAEDFAGEPRLLEPEKHSAMGWFAPDDLPMPVAQAVTAAVEAMRARQVRSA